VIREIRWPEVIATALCIVGLGVVGLYFHAYEPKAFSQAESDAMRRKALVNCGYSMFDVDPQAMQCKAFDTLAVQVSPCWGPQCGGYTMTLHANGDAQLLEPAPDYARGTYVGDVDKADFRRLANLVALHALDRRGSLDGHPSAGGDVVVRAGCGGDWKVTANLGGEAGEIEGLGVCFAQLKQGISWDRTR
jgi:hypothetical protein